MCSKFILAALPAMLVCAAACSGGATSGTSTLPPPSGAPGASGAPSTSAITEFPIVGGDSGPAAITVALDGDPWFLSNDGVNRMTPAGSIAQSTSLEFSRYNSATDIIVGPDGALWFTANCAVADLVCTPDVMELVRTTSGSFTPVSGAGTTEQGPLPSALVNGTDTTIWIASNQSATVAEVGSGYFAVKTDGTIVVPVHTLPQPCIDAPGAPSFGFYSSSDIARGSDGAFYIAASSPCGDFPVPQGVSVVLRVDPSGNITNTYPVPNVQGIAAGPDGNLWVTQSGTTNAVGRLTTSGTLTEYPLPTPNAAPLRITLGNDGNLWFTERGASKIGRVTTTGVISEYATPTPNAEPYDIASLPGECGPGHGDIWFTEITAGKIGRMLF